MAFGMVGTGDVVKVLVHVEIHIEPVSSSK
jgi:hypothetical protein